ncbi:hypothetical protein [Streptomyces racemochromogenes]|uniref:hypothetical protein n=1 Tax=Streptomyces racemochromogenes TaxID=67353 RepID=UPI0031E605C4
MSLLGIARPSGRHRVLDRLLQLEHLLARERAATGELRRRLVEATEARDAANAKASRLGDAVIREAEATQRATALEAEVTALRSQLANHRKTGTLAAHPAVAETQPIPVLPLHLSPLAGTSPTHIPGA